MLRHTHASNLLSQGVPLSTGSVRLGHADANVTARIYSHALPDDDARAVDAWETIIRRQSSVTKFTKTAELPSVRSNSPRRDFLITG